MTLLTPSVEEIVGKLVRIARGDPTLVEEALGRASGQTDRPPTLEQLVDYIVAHRKPTAQAAR